MDNSIIHLLLELLAGVLLLFIGYMAGRLYRLSNTKGLSFLSLCGYSVGFLNIAHGLVAISGLASNLAFFIPATRLLGKILFSSILLMAFYCPKKIGIIASFLFGSIIGGFALIIPYNGIYYVDEWVMGRPAEWVAFFISIVGIVVYSTRKSTELGTYVCYSLLITLITQITMVFSHGLFDTLFTIAHISQVLSIVPLLLYINKRMS